MKKMTRSLFSLVLAGVMMFSFSVTSLAAGKVTYEGSAKKFIFEPGSVLKSKLAVSVLEKVPRRNRDGVKVSREKLFII